MIRRLIGERDLPSSYAGGIDYYALEEMKKLIRWCHKFYDKKMMLNDLMYTLTIIKFGDKLVELWAFYTLNLF